MRRLCGDLGRTCFSKFVDLGVRRKKNGLCDVEENETTDALAKEGSFIIIRTVTAIEVLAVLANVAFTTWEQAYHYDRWQSLDTVRHMVQSLTCLKARTLAFTFRTYIHISSE